MNFEMILEAHQNYGRDLEPEPPLPDDFYSEDAEDREGWVIDDDPADRPRFVQRGGQWFRSLPVRRIPPLVARKACRGECQEDGGRMMPEQLLMRWSVSEFPRHWPTQTYFSGQLIRSIPTQRTPQSVIEKAAWDADELGVETWTCSIVRGEYEH